MGAAETDEGGEAVDLVDRQLVGELIQAIGIEDYRSLLDSLSGEVEALTSDLEAQAAASEEAGFRRTAHRLAGLLSQFGAVKAGGIAEGLHKGRHDGDLKSIAESLRAICSASLVVILEACGSFGGAGARLAGGRP